MTRRTLVATGSASLLGSMTSGCALLSQPGLGGNKARTDQSVKSPIIIAHRGASGYLPEHTLPAYRLGAALGADYIEPDLVFTKEGHLIARHDNYLSTTTDVADRPEFAARKTEKPGHEGADWFTEDFTLAEIKTLRARQSLPFRSKAADGKFAIPTFDEVIALAQAESKTRGRAIGVYPETKQPGYFAALGYDFPKTVLGALEKAGWSEPNAPVFIQSFETPVLKELRTLTALPLVYLFGRPPELSMNDIAEFADGLGPFKGLLAGNDGVSTGLIESAHDAGLNVHPWTFRSDQLPAQFETAHEELAFFYALGVDGVFTDFPDAAFAARSARAMVSE